MTRATASLRHGRWQTAALAAGVVGGVAAALAVRSFRRPRFDLNGRTVIVTGGGRGLGYLLAREFAWRGARVFITSRTTADLRRAERRLRDSGLDVTALSCDIREITQVARLVSQVVAQTGRIDVLVNNAGIVQMSPLDHTRLDDYEDSLATHLWGPMYLVRECLPYMRALGEGRILNVASIGGRIAIPHCAPYSVGKFALVGLSASLRAELARERILVTTATPGLMRTGAHVHARVRGRHQREAFWLGAGLATPLTSMNAARAARQMTRATLDGRAQVTPGIQARLAACLQAAAPELSATVSAALTRLVLPGPSSDSSADLVRVAGEVGFGALEPLLTRGPAGSDYETEG